MKIQINQLKTELRKFASQRVNLVGVGVALALLVGASALYAVNATANAPAAADIAINGWVDQLSNDKLTTERQTAQRNLESAGEAAVPQLMVAVRSDNASLRRNAADMLGYIASPLATQTLVKTLQNDPVPAVRRNAAWALGEIKDTRAFSTLQQASVTDRNQLVRATASDSLARIRTTLAQAAGVSEQLIGAFGVSPAQNDVVYVGSKRDVLVSHDAGKTWQTFANVLPSQISSLAVNPKNTNELYAGVDALGVYKSVDGGATWKVINTGIELTPGARTVTSAIAIDPSDPQIIYLASGVWLGTSTVEFYPTGLMYSHDGGDSWQALTAGSESEAIAKLAFRDGQLFGLAGDRVLTLMTPR